MAEVDLRPWINVIRVALNVLNSASRTPEEYLIQMHRFRLEFLARVGCVLRTPTSWNDDELSFNIFALLK